MTRTVPTKIKAVRDQFRQSISQEMIAHEAGMSSRTYYAIESRNANTSYTTALRIQRAFNHYRALQGMSELSLDDLGMNIV